MAAVLAILKLARASIQNARAGRQCLKRFRQPDLAVFFVDVFYYCHGLALLTDLVKYKNTQAVLFFGKLGKYLIRGFQFLNAIFVPKHR